VPPSPPEALSIVAPRSSAPDVAGLEVKGGTELYGSPANDPFTSDGTSR
jgi:hypothetical protein